MSTYYRPRTPLKLDDVRKIKEFDVVKDGKDWGFQSKDCFLSVETNSKGYVMDVYRHGQNDVDDIFPDIKSELGVSFISEGEMNYINYRDEESKVYMLRFENGSTCYRTKSEDDSGVVSLQYSFDGESNLYDPNNREKSNGVAVEETSMVETIPFKSIQHLKDSLCRWLDNTVENYGGDKEVSSNVDDDCRLHLMVHDVVVTDLEEIGDGQHYYMTVEQVKRDSNQ
ncbi:MAG: hypothetical protein H8D80_00365 [Proteobacteria bacterium]|nr:hypothetical protein [Pseudomonadota bacterium]